MKWLITFAPKYRTPEVYLNWVRSASVEPVAYRTNDEPPGDLADFDALLLSGGGDVDPSLYGCAPEPETDGVDPRRDLRETALIRDFIRREKPVFGICRGIQILQVVFGAPLIQHVPRFLAGQPLPANEERHTAPDPEDAVHPLILNPDTAMGRHLATVRTVNSHHHQALDPRRIPHTLRVTARSPAGVIEAIEGVGFAAPVQAVQWHPERLPPEAPGSRLLLDLWTR
ncbi:MAG: gamma-glutamyl-gamma-aminobutyrate hydrolase family protein [Kiritimatiellia bacterium]|nr:gamma-glutamyl-gamma-aminobutyrate hydrolase family protein [Kiritimatiellia bacterium]